MPVSDQQKFDDKLSLKFYNDAIANGVRSLINGSKTYVDNSNYNIKDDGMVLSFEYKLNYWSPFISNEESSYGISDSLIDDGISYGEDYVKRLIDEKAKFPVSTILDGLMGSKYSTLDFNEDMKKEHSVKDYTVLKIEFLNCFLVNLGFGSFDMERTDTYSEGEVLIGYNGARLSSMYDGYTKIEL
jgi:hypothetical protein